jgi:hypothetical protein
LLPGFSNTTYSGSCLLDLRPGLLLPAALLRAHKLT